MILAGLLLITVLLAGVSYAVFNSYASQNSTNTLAATCIELEFSGENSVNLTNVYPISDSEGLKTTPYKFKIKNKCKNYLEYIVIVSVINVTNPLDSKYVKVNLSGDNEMNSVALSSLKSIQTPASLSGYSIKENYVLKDGDGILKDEERNFEFRMWLDGENEETWTSEQVESKNYQVKISVIGTVKTEPKDDLYIAALIDGEESTTFPTTKDYTATVNCTRKGKKIDANESIEWTGLRWALTTTITDGNTRCNVEFESRPTWENPGKNTLLAAIKNGNTVTEPLTVPGTETSAHTLDDAPSRTASLDSTDQAYYITYGTGWEANGTKFNLTGASVTSDTYANSYSSLAGKYLIDSYIPSTGSSTAGEMKTTTNLKSVYYVVSATATGYTYKTLGSNKNTTEALLASTEDDYGTSYYFRGTVKNNYVQFANKCWRIVRIGGDGSVKLILHNDNTAGAANPCNSANNSTSAAFARYSGTTYTSAFNTNYIENANVGFMYGNVGCSDGVSTSQSSCTSAGGTWTFSTSYANAHANINKSTILTNLETWYNNNLKTYESVIDNSVWCNDKTNVTDISYDPFSFGEALTGLGYARKITYYRATQRLVSASGSDGGTGPSLKCNGELSKITSKIGLITADELVFAGYAGVSRNTTTYLQENATDDKWYSLSPNDFHVGGGAIVWAVNGGLGSLSPGGFVNSTYGVRPSISLKPFTNVTGNGTSDTPYKIVS